MMAVVVVPMLEPSVSGYALSMLITPMPGDRERTTEHRALVQKWQEMAAAAQEAREKLTNQRGQGRSEHGAALHDEGHAGPHEDGQVAGHPGKGEREVCRTEGEGLLYHLLRSLVGWAGLEDELVPVCGLRFSFSSLLPK